MSWLYGITKSERIAAEQLAGSSIRTIEIAANLIQDVVSQYFEGREEKALDEWEAMQIGHNLAAASYMLSDALTRYHCNFGHYDEPTVEGFSYTADVYKQTCEAERLYDEAIHICGAEAVKAADMDNESAIKYCKEIMARKETNAQA